MDGVLELSRQQILEFIASGPGDLIFERDLMHNVKALLLRMEL